MEKFIKTFFCFGAILLVAGTIYGMMPENSDAAPRQANLAATGNYIAAKTDTGVYYLTASIDEYENGKR